TRPPRPMLSAVLPPRSRIILLSPRPRLAADVFTRGGAQILHHGFALLGEGVAPLGWVDERLGEHLTGRDPAQRGIRFAAVMVAGSDDLRLDGVAARLVHLVEVHAGILQRRQEALLPLAAVFTLGDVLDLLDGTVLRTLAARTVVAGGRALILGVVLVLALIVALVQLRGCGDARHGGVIGLLRVVDGAARAACAGRAEEGQARQDG